LILLSVCVTENDMGVWFIRALRWSYIRSKHCKRILQNIPKLDCMLKSLHRKTIVSCGYIVSEFAG